MLAVTNIALSLEAIGILLGVLVSLTILLSVLVNFTNKFHHLEIKVQYLQQEIVEHSNLEGHKVLCDKLVRNSEYISRIEKALELHIQDYLNRKDVTQYMFGQLDQKIDHKFGRLHSSMRDMEKFMQKSNDFRIREYLEEPKE